MDALLIGPALVLSFGLTLVVGKALLTVFMSAMENRGAQPKTTSACTTVAERQNQREAAVA